MPKTTFLIAQVRRYFPCGMQAALAAAVLCAGCANFTPVTPEEDGGYHLSATGVSYTMSMPTLTAASRDKARAWCAAQNKDMQLRQQSRSWQPVQVELSFRCVARKQDDQGNAVEQQPSLTTFK